MNSWEEVPGEITAAGQLGDGTTDDSEFPVTIMEDEYNPLTNAVAVSAGAGGVHTAILLDDGRVKVCGRNNFGQVGDGTKVDKYYPATSHIFNLGW